MQINTSCPATRKSCQMLVIVFSLQLIHLKVQRTAELF